MNRHIDHTIKTLSTKEIQLTTTQVQLAISNSTNNNSTGPDGINIRHLININYDHLPSDTSQICTTLPSTLTQYPIFGNEPQSSTFQNQTRPQTLDKLSTHIISITHCQNTRENTITTHNRKHSNHFSSTWI